MQGKTQKELILDHLCHGLSITPAKAMAEYGTMRLAAYIHELRQEGWPIETYTRKSLSGKTYGEYRMKKGDPVEEPKEAPKEEEEPEEKGWLKIGKKVWCPRHGLGEITEEKIVPFSGKHIFKGSFPDSPTGIEKWNFNPDGTMCGFETSKARTLIEIIETEPSNA